MALHNLIVHFPIAFLILYSISEFIWYKKLLKTTFWFYFKAILVILGVITGMLALQTGEFLQDSGNNLIKKHEFWANNTVLIFGLISLFYCLTWIDKSEKIKLNYGTLIEKVWRKLTKFSRFILKRRWIIILISILGFISLIMTGLIGYIISHK